MRGYTKEQLEARNANLANYIRCENCSLYWHRRVFKKHLAVPTRADCDDYVEIVHPAWANFIDFLVDGAIKQWMKDRDERIARGEPVVAPASEEAAEPPKSRKRTMTVDEAAVHLGVPREEILREFEKRMIPFEFTLPPLPSRRRARGS